jgi:hypothetical protein
VGTEIKETILHISETDLAQISKLPYSSFDTEIETADSTNFWPESLQFVQQEGTENEGHTSLIFWARISRKFGSVFKKIAGHILEISLRVLLINILL